MTKCAESVGQAPGAAGREPFTKARTATNKSAEAGRRDRSKLAV